jgi:hypothetical protein
MGALALATRGYISPGTGGGGVTSDAPVLSQVVELKPTLLDASADVPPAPVTVPSVVSTHDLRPTIRSAQNQTPESSFEDDAIYGTFYYGDMRYGSGNYPETLAVIDLKPVIISADEE